jgi:predicted nucleic acid-binding protein
VKRSTAFWDSSALIPLCVQEQTSNKVKTLAKQFAPVVWWATTVEIYSAIARLRRSGELDDAGRQAALNRLSVLSQGWREILPSDKLRVQAGVLLDTYSLRAADSLQLASAMIWCQQRPARQRFVSSDFRLCQAAAQAGFAVLRPEGHANSKRL